MNVSCIPSISYNKTGTRMLQNRAGKAGARPAIAGLPDVSGSFPRRQRGGWGHRNGILIEKGLSSRLAAFGIPRQVPRPGSPFSNVTAVRANWGNLQPALPIRCPHPAGYLGHRFSNLNTPAKSLQFPSRPKPMIHYGPRGNTLTSGCAGDMCRSLFASRRQTPVSYLLNQSYSRSRNTSRPTP